MSIGQGKSFAVKMSHRLSARKVAHPIEILNQGRFDKYGCSYYKIFFKNVIHLQVVM